ncbi:MAG: SUF system Fe-S cluster assembly regulator [Planctomycetota bacterium]
MLRMSKHADYGIVLLSYFAGEEAGSLHSARDLAEAAGLPLPTVSKILKALARGGVLESHLGAHGGYTLSRRPERTSVAAILQAVEGPIGVTECSPSAEGDCAFERDCPVRSPLQRLNAVVHQTLERVSLRELIDPRAPLAPSRPRAMGV